MSFDLQNFYKSTLLLDWTIGTGNFYVTTKPTVSTGWLVISPNNTSIREIVKYTATGTDSNGDYVTVSVRGVGGTTEQIHTIGEPIRMNITAEYWDAMNDDIAAIVASGVSNANTTTMGGVEIATDAEVVAGTNTGGTGASLVPTPGQLPLITSGIKLFGSGIDGDVTVTTTITLSSDMYYNNLTVTSPGIINTGGYRIFVKGTLSGDGIIQNNGNAASLATAGATSGNGWYSGTVAGTNGGAAKAGPGAGNNGASAGNSLLCWNPIVGIQGSSGGGVSGGAPGTGGTLGTATAPVVKPGYWLWYTINGWDTTKAGVINPLLITGVATGGGSGGAQGGGSSGAGGGGGASGGVVGVFCKILSGSITFKALGGNGGAGGDGTGGADQGGGGGGAGGNGGIVLVIYGYKSAYTGTYLVTGGTGGAKGLKLGAGSDGTIGSNGSTGISYELQIATLI